MNNEIIKVLSLLGLGLVALHLFARQSVQETYTEYPQSGQNGGVLTQSSEQDVQQQENDYRAEHVVPHYQSENGLAKTVMHSQIDNAPQDADPVMTKHVRDQLYQTNTNVLPNPQMSNNYSSQGAFQPDHAHTFSQLDCFPKDNLKAEELLPREDKYHIWNESNPNVQGHLSNKNFIEAGHHYGLNTVSNSLKNANRQLRSDPLIPKKNVGPWLQSTYEADTNRRPFEIGGC